MQYTIDEVREKIFSKVYEVYEIFQNFFGEERTDLQGIPEDESMRLIIQSIGGTRNRDGKYDINDTQLSHAPSYRADIIIWWPYVTITNENGRSVQIQDLYAKVEINTDGKIPYEYRGFMLTRTTFSAEQWASHYLHSHVPRVHGTPGWEHPCLGTGPINNTILDLHNECDETLWMLFCQELSMYVTVESLTGGPHIRMETIGFAERMTDYAGYTFNRNFSFSGISYNTWRYTSVGEAGLKKDMEDFLEYYLKHGHLSFNYKNGRYVPGMTYYDYMIDVSNSFIEWYNQRTDKAVYLDQIYSRHTMVKALVSDGIFYKPDRRREADTTYNGNPVLVFKGEQKNLFIDSTIEFEPENTLVLNQDIAMYIIFSILKIINYRYNNEYNKSTGGEEGSSPTYKTVRYV